MVTPSFDVAQHGAVPATQQQALDSRLKIAGMTDLLPDRHAGSPLAGIQEGGGDGDTEPLLLLRNLYATRRLSEIVFQDSVGCC